MRPLACRVSRVSASINVQSVAVRGPISGSLPPLKVVSMDAEENGDPSLDVLHHPIDLRAEPLLHRCLASPRPCADRRDESVHAAMGHLAWPPQTETELRDDFLALILREEAVETSHGFVRGRHCHLGSTSLVIARRSKSVTDRIVPRQPACRGSAPASTRRRSAKALS